jgi:hypothetical protein
MPSLAAFVALVLTAFSAPALAGPPSCLQFEPAVSSIHGKLERRTYPGPPNYEDIGQGDEAETHWYVRLAEPICVDGKPGDEFNGQDVAGVRLIQLVLLHDEYKTHARLVGKKVKATGSLFTWHTGHHRTPVLLKVTRLERSTK